MLSPEETEIKRELYEHRINELRAEFYQTVEHSKPVTDFALLFSTQTGVMALAFLLFGKLQTEPWSAHLALGFIATVIFAWLLNAHAATALQKIIEMNVLKVLELMPARFNFQERHLVLRAIWRALLTTAWIAASWGVGYTFAELLKIAVVK